MKDTLLNELSGLLHDTIVEAQPIAAGQNETARLILANGEQYFAKYTSNSQVRFEQRVLQILSAQNVDGFDFPKLYNNKQTPSADKCFLITSFINSHAVTADILFERLTELTDALVALHNLPKQAFVSLEVIWPLNLIAANELQTSLFASSQQEAVRCIINNYQNALSYIRDDKHSPLFAVNHGDLSVDNLLYSNQGFALIDWEYAKITDVRWDLATIAVEFQLSSLEFQELCKHYAIKRALSVDNFVEGARKWRDIYRFISLHWAINYNQPIETYLIQT